MPAENLIGEEGQGFRYILDGMNAERILIASEAIGDGRWFIDKAARYANERVVFDRPIGATRASSSRSPGLRRHRGGGPDGAQGRRAVRSRPAVRRRGQHGQASGSEASWQAAEAALQTHGGFGFAAEYDVERKWRETRLFQVAPISTNLILAYLAEHVLGMPRSY